VDPAGRRAAFRGRQRPHVGRISTRGEVEIGAPQKLFGADDFGTQLFVPRVLKRFYGIAPDGTRFVVVKGVRMATSALVLSEGELGR
jgi:hypothetical protein